MKSLADGFVENKLDVGWAVGTILRSKAFFAEANIGTRVKGPAEFIVAAARALDLFEPPNVGGWPGGRAWIGARSMIARSNLVAALVDGSNAGRSKAYDPDEL